MTAGQRATFERDGYLIIRGSLGPDGSMHLLSAVANCPEVVGLIDHDAMCVVPAKPQPFTTAPR